MPGVLPGTPREDGFRMPAEWEPHDGCYLVWPERPDTWRDGGKPAQAAWVRLADCDRGERAGHGAGERPASGATPGRGCRRRSGSSR